MTDDDAKAGRAPDVTDGARGSKDSFGGNAAVVQSIAAEQVPFDQGNAGTKARSAHRADQPGGPAAEYHEVVLRGRLRIAPCRRMHPGQQLSVRIVWRGDGMSLRRRHRANQTLDSRWRSARRFTFI